MLILLNNQLDAASRNFLQLYRDKVEKIIEWTDLEQASEYLQEGNPSPSAFPSVVDTEKKIIVRRPVNWEEVEAQLAIQGESNAEKIFKAKVLDGFYPEGKDFALGLNKEDREAFSQLLTLVQEGVSQGKMQGGDPISLVDKNGHIQILTINEFRAIMLDYGFYFKTIWDASKAG